MHETGSALGVHLGEPMLRRIRERALLESQLDFQDGFAQYSKDDEAAGAAVLAIDKALAGDSGSLTGMGRGGSNE